MGVPTSEVDNTTAMPRREDHKVHKDMWWGGGGGHFYERVLRSKVRVGILFDIKI
jgi:hypothetical protein